MKRILIAATLVIAGILVILYLSTIPIANQLNRLCAKQQSTVIKDRYNNTIRILPNSKGHYSWPLKEVPTRFKKLVVQQEDRFFYYHFGVNPFSIARSLSHYLFRGRLTGSSTITQQLVKLLLGHESKRTVRNKIVESIYAIALELHSKKKEILRLYANNIYFGNLAQGLEEASRYYFNKSAESLDDKEIRSLLSIISNPSRQSLKMAKNINRKTQASFELESLGIDCQFDCILSIDANLTEKLRQILKQNLLLSSFASAENGAIVVLKLPENELLALVGSVDPYGRGAGSQINMALKPRPIGSTIKPFIYLKTFEHGLRPYTLINDREYRYQIGSGFALYPKDYDEKYRGLVTARQALSESLNVPALKVLEFAGLDDFYEFLTVDLAFQPIQPLDNYQLGIALGGLEMDLLTLSNYFTIFPSNGVIKPLKIIKTDSLTPPPMAKNLTEHRISQNTFIQLINKILSDREAGVEQFGIKSHLNLSQPNYALKTGTSREFLDSWTIGYTPDFLVGVWIGNSSNKPMDMVSGAEGAGKIWSQAMEIMFASPYNKKTAFDFSKIKEYQNANTVEYGLADDDYDWSRNLLIQEQSLIISPHNGDKFLFEAGMVIPLVSLEEVKWTVGDIIVGRGKKVNWQPEKAGEYAIRAEKGDVEEDVRVRINEVD
ncbi:MAG: transglycosylase domain-containing protein [Patescibacteria group bacterium]